MFTGVVQEVGTVRHAAPSGAGTRIEIASGEVVERLAAGDAVLVSGARLRVIERDDHGFVCDVPGDMLTRTNLARLSRGSRVNLERAPTASTALGGHIVRGEIDAAVPLIARSEQGVLRIGLARAIARYVVPRGYLAIDGASVIVSRVGKTFFEVQLEPDVARRSTLGTARPGDVLNIETDVLARYVERVAKRT